MRSKKLRLWMAFLMVLAMVPSQALLASSEAFNKAVKAVQKSPEDLGLRKKLFTLARSQKSLPEVPDDVAILKGKAAYIVKTANSPADFGPAVDAYQEATNLAPWVPDLYYNLGVVQEKAGRAQDAIASFKLYLAAAPDADDRDKVLARLGGLEVQKDKQVQSSTEASVATSHAAVNSAAHQQWEGKRGGQVAVAVVSGLTLGLGAVFLGVGAGEAGGALYTSSPGYSQGVLYNKPYDGKYFSAASYDDYTNGQALMGVGWVFLGVGVVGCIVAIAMDPGPEPKMALLDLQGEKLACGMPEIKLAPRGDGLNLSLLHATF